MAVVYVRFAGAVADQTFSYVAPFGATEIRAIVVAGAGAGGSAQNAGARGGGGAGGSVAIVTIGAEAAHTYTCVVGGQQSTSGGTGKDSHFKDGATFLATAKGGAGGQNVTAGGGTGGVGSTTGCVGDTFFRGGNGSAGVAGTSSGAGGGGGGSTGQGQDALGINGGAATNLLGGKGANGTTSGTGQNGSPGDFYGGAGSGGVANSGTLRTGGLGRPGYVLLAVTIMDNTPTGPTSGPLESVACEAFTGANVGNIQGRAWDGCGGAAPGINWYADNGTNPYTLGILDENLVVTYPVEAEIYYLMQPVPVCGDDRNTQAVRWRAIWPNLDTPGVAEACTLIWEDTFDGLAGPLADREHTGGSAGTGTYRRVDNFSGSSHPDGAQLDGAGAVYLPSPGRLIAQYDIFGLTLPSAYDVVIDVERTNVASGLRGSVGATVRGNNPYPPSSGADGRVNYGLTYATENGFFSDNLHGSWTGWVGSSGNNFGTAITGSTLDPPGDHGINVGETRSIMYRVKSGNTIVTAYIGDEDQMEPCSGTWRPGGAVADCQFGFPCLGTANGNPGIRWNPLATLTSNESENSYRIKRVAIYQYTAPSSGFVFTDSYAGVILRYDYGATNTGYQVVFEGAHTSAGTDWNLAYWIWCWGNTFTGYLRQNTFVPDSIPRTQTEPYTFDAVIANNPNNGNPTIYAICNGQVAGYFDLITDVPDDTPGGSPLTSDDIFTKTDAEFLMFDGAPIDRGQPSIEVLDVQIMCPGDTCTGWTDPDGPGPGGGGEEFPPLDPLIDVKKFGSWYSVPLSQVQVRKGGAFYQPTAVSVRKRGAWYTLTPGIGDDIDDPIGDPNPEEPPAGCEAPPEFPTPTEEPVPYAGQRIFFAYNMPEGGRTAPMDTTVWAMGGRSTLDKLAVCADRGLHMFTSVGNYAKFFSGGQYSPRVMDAWIHSFDGFEAEFKHFFDLGVWLWQIVIDDYQSAERWGVRISEDEVNRIAGVWKAMWPWMRCWLRNTPLNINRVDPSAVYGNMDGFYCQYVTRYGNLESWISGNKFYAQNWGSKDLAWGINSLNLNGRDRPATVADVDHYMQRFAVEPYSVGIGYWRWDIGWQTQGIIDALTRAYNLQALTWP